MEFGVAIVRRDVGTIVGDVVEEFISTAGAGVGSKTLVMFGILSTITSCWSSPACMDTFCGTLAMLNNVVVPVIITNMTKAASAIARLLVQHGL